MKKLILLFSLFVVTTAVSAQSELPADTISRPLTENYKEYGGFLLDMNLLSIAAPQLPKMKFDKVDISKDYNQLFRLNPDVTFSQGLSNVFAPSYFGAFGVGGFGSFADNLQMGSFRLKNGMRINTYGEYNADGYKVPNRSALPWEKNNFKGAFEMKSANGSFGIRIEVQQGRNAPF